LIADKKAFAMADDEGADVGPPRPVNEDDLDVGPTLPTVKRRKVEIYA